MSKNVKITTNLPADDRFNGLDSIQQQLINNPLELQAAIIVFDAPESSTNAEQGTVTPKATIRRVEPLGPVATLAQRLPEMQKAYDEAYRRRLGPEQPLLPLDITKAENGRGLDDDGDEDA